ncbi:MAG: redox-regulated ATPase YchF [Calditrichaeota bacterium]|nr:redox-regulated ATPase YchF [Calditrichota bacterium]
MGFKCGLVGLPNVGKSTIFNALTAQQVASSNYPFCTIDPNIGVVPLHDERLEKIAEIIGSEKSVPTTLEFIDIAGLVKGASQGEGLGNQFLNHIQAVDAVAHVVRCFEDKNVAHTSENLDPILDLEVVITELILKDLEIVERRVSRLQHAVKSGDAKLKEELAILTKIQDHLSRGIPLKKMELNEKERDLIREMNLLTLKPAIYIANVDESHLQNNDYAQQLKSFAETQREPFVAICGKIQEEISQLDTESQAIFLKEWGIDELSLNAVVRAGYEVLHLNTFFTANENEAHAWTVPQATPVHRAAGKVHTDFEKGFIKAEVIKYADLARLDSEREVRQRGLMGVHGKDYLVQDGDLIFFHAHR